MKLPNFHLVTFAAALALAMTIPAAWAHPPKDVNDQPSSYDNRPVPMTNIYAVPGGCCWGGAILKYNEPIKLTFSQSVRIPGKVLPAGSYWFVMQDTATGNTVDVLDANQRVITTLATGDAEMPGYYPDRPLVTLAEGGPGQPDAVVSWFLPGMNLGHQFIYSKSERRAIEEQPTVTLHLRWGGNYLHG